MCDWCQNNNRLLQPGKWQSQGPDKGVKVTGNWDIIHIYSWSLIDINFFKKYSQNKYIILKTKTSVKNWNGRVRVRARVRTRVRDRVRGRNSVRLRVWITNNNLNVNKSRCPDLFKLTKTVPQAWHQSRSM